MILDRKVRVLLEHRLKSYPAVALVGPRQSGKTTLARALSTAFFDLEIESERLRLDIEWPSLMRKEGLIVFDEAHRCPELFTRLRGAIDVERKRKNRFLLLGSISPALMHHVSESLAGRLSVIELSPFILPELSNTPIMGH